MFNKIYPLFFAMLVVFFSSCSNDNNTTVEPEMLPKEAQEFLSSHYNGVSIIVVNKNESLNYYEANLANGVTITFNLEGCWKEINFGEDNEVPPSIFAILPISIKARIVMLPLLDVIKLRNAVLNQHNWEIEVKLNDFTFNMLFNLKGEIIYGKNCDGKLIITIDKLPQIVREFISLHYKAIDVFYIEQDENGEYSIVLLNGTKIKFSANGDWKEVKTKFTLSLVKSVIALLPKPIQEYIFNMSGAIIFEIENIYSENQWEIKVFVNGKKVKLKFNAKGELISKNEIQEQSVFVKKLPLLAKNFLKQHFDLSGVISVERDDDGYEVKLTNGIEIEFDLQGNWKEIKAKKHIISLPSSILALLPRNIQNYILKEKITIVKKIERLVVDFDYFWELEVILNGKEYELKFDAKGRLISKES